MSISTTYVQKSLYQLLVSAIHVQDPGRMLLNTFCTQATFLLLLYCIPVAQRGNYFEGLGLAIVAAIASGIAIPQNIRATNGISRRPIRMMTTLVYLALPVLIFLFAMSLVYGICGSGTLVQLGQFRDAIALAFPALVMLFAMIPMLWYQTHWVRKRGEH